MSAIGSPLGAYLVSFDPPEVPDPPRGDPDKWWRSRVQQAVTGEMPPDNSYWHLVWNGLFGAWARAMADEWHGPQSKVIDEIMRQVERILWPERRGSANNRRS